MAAPPGIKGKQLVDAMPGSIGVSTAKINDNAVTSAKVDGSVLSTNGANLPLGDYDFLNQKGINVAPGIAGTDAVNVNQLNALIQGLDWKDNVVTATAAPLPAYTFTAAGGGTLTANANAALPAIGGIILAVNQRVLIRSETGLNQPYNGIYTVTDAGSNVTPWILVRSVDANTSAKVTQGMATAVADPNSTEYGYIWVLTTSDVPSIVLNTTNLSFNGIPLVTSYVFAAGLLQVGLTVSVKKGNGIEVVSNGLATNADIDTAAGMRFTGASPNGKIATKFDTLTTSKGGLSYGPNGGLQAQVNTTTGALQMNGGNEIEVIIEPSTPTTGGLEIGPSLGLQQKLDPAGAIEYTAVGTGVKLDANSALAKSAAGLKFNSNLVEEEPGAIASAGQATKITNGTLGFTPMRNNTGQGIVAVYINGVRYQVGNSTAPASIPSLKLYFSADGGITPKDWATIAAADELYRGGDLGFDTDTNDGRLMITYLKQT